MAVVRPGSELRRWSDLGTIRRAIERYLPERRGQPVGLGESLNCAVGPPLPTACAIGTRCALSSTSFYASGTFRAGGFMRSLGPLLIFTGIAVAAHGSLRTEVPPVKVAHVPAAVSEPHFTVTQMVTLRTTEGVMRRPLPQAPSATVAQSLADGPNLVRELQRELNRVQCYDGPLDGAWTASTRSAMSAFINRANARLPTDKPDLALLALVQSHAGDACGSCPSGQEAAADGRCLPIAIVARFAAKRPPLPENPTALKGSGAVSLAAAAAPPKRGRIGDRRPPMEGRMGMGMKIAAAAGQEPLPKEVVPRREGHAARRGSRHSARAHLRPARYAYRAFRGPRGLAGLLFGWF